MKPLLVALLFLVASCAYQPTPRKVEKTSPPIYYLPVKGEVSLTQRGLSIKSRCGDFVRAVESGKVAYAGKDLGSLGWVVIVEQSDGFVSVYGKLGKPWVRAGERVKRRQVIAKTERIKGSCGLYYELRDSKGDTLNPIFK